MQESIASAFREVRQGKTDEVAAILDRKPELIACTATAPPRKDNDVVLVVYICV